MKRNLKKIAAMAMAASIMAGAMFPTTALAASKTTAAYGTLTGTLSGTKTKGSAKTTVTKNPDNANLTLSVDFKKSVGGNVIETKAKTGRGGKSIQMDWKNMPSRVGCAYGAHGVQGGSKYPAYAVYTYTTLK
ncbi:MAG: hypothetical protein NC412_11650 [Roseburia sp.]|nr:hypothetical protein [Roseburia sp.]MCM1279437.1 hypothetical protein [Robinsoniella sp.]